MNSGEYIRIPPNDTATVSYRIKVFDNFPSNYDPINITTSSNDQARVSEGEKSHKVRGNWTMYSSNRTGNSPVYIDLSSYERKKEEVNSGSEWYKGTPLTTDQRRPISGVYDPFERQNFLRSFPPKSDDPETGSDLEEGSNEQLYFPNYYPPTN